MERKQLRETLLTEFESVEKEHVAACSAHEQACATTTEIEMDKKLLQIAIAYIPHLIRKTCVDYERFSKRKGKLIGDLRRTILDNHFWDARRAGAIREAYSFHNTLREMLSSQAEFVTSEQDRLQSVLEVEEMKLAYLAGCLKDITEGTPTRRVTPPQDRVGRRAYTAPVAAIAHASSVWKPGRDDPFSDWEDRRTSPDIAGRTSDRNAIGGYRFRYPTRNDAEQTAEQDSSENEGSHSTHSSPLVQRRTEGVARGSSAAHQEVTISTSTVTEVSQCFCARKKTSRDT